MKISADDPLWFKSAIIYQLHVKAFSDSDGDGMGDFRGLIGKLDYLADLGVTALWLLPFYPSPLRDDGYDIADYTSVHPGYGTLDDFKEFLDAAHARGLRVITELVLNHSSDQHAWFQRARKAPPGSDWRNFYVWSDTPDRYREAADHFQGFENSNWTLDPVAKAYYWHPLLLAPAGSELRTSGGAARDARRRARLLVRAGRGRPAARCGALSLRARGHELQNLPETHEFLRRFRAHIDARYPGRMLLAEANQWPEDAVAYFGNGDEMPHGVSFSADAAPVHGAADGGPFPRHRHPRPDPAIPRPASGRCFCATMTS